MTNFRITKADEKMPGYYFERRSGFLGIAAPHRCG
jgi:hypothetical protein